MPLHQRVRLTQYGYTNDPYGDSLTRQGLGAWGNKLNLTSCALKASTAEKIGAKPRSKILILMGGLSGRFMVRWFDDHVPESDPGDRCDLYMPSGFDGSLPDVADIQVMPDDGTTPASPV